ncbi:hypothetical protein BDP27DRAFT_1348742 [Rhodocollybia butyracea]|uniref:F-box domain-containing protein n=1 Tax=Rhodocollybia butyracea TaxID=206335 RepID=A0A9P5TX50_9AGAR|nr:hypothetical protein BDP27DRAFT_1348742 [Rhodocollybia butyracea]
MPLCSSCGGKAFIPRVPVDLSALHDKLRTEFGPASIQPDDVASVLQDIQRDLEDYEAEISRLERLRQEKERLQEYATQLRYLLSPFRKVPDELLREIFDLSCDMNTFRVVNPGKRLPMHTYQALGSKPAMVISSVCSRWRRNALSMPVIWSRISLQWKLDSQDDGYEDEDTEVFFPLSNFLDRSKQCSMTVNLDIHGDPFLKPKVLHPSLEKLFGQITRWKDLSFNSDYYDVQELLDCDRISSASFPVLSILHTSACVDEKNIGPFLGAAPNLRSLSLASTLRDVPENFSYSSQLSHLDFVPDKYHIPNLFDRCPRLFSLRITEWLYRNSENHKMIISSSRLEILTVRHGCYWADDASDSVFPFFRLPSLKALHLEPFMLMTKGGKSWCYFDSFMAFVQRSSFQLTTFSIQQLPISDANLIDILVLLPTLQNLTVDDSGISPEYSSISSGFIESLCSYRTSSLRPQEAAIIPRLRSLRLLNVGVTTFNDQSVLEMVQSRWNPTRLNDVGTSVLEVDCLRAFTMTFPNRSEAEAGVYSSLAPIEKDGMMIVVRLGQSDYPRL